MLKPQIDPRVRQAVDYICLHFRTKICLRELSRSVGVSVPHLVYLFKRELGVTFKEHLRRMRIQESQELMRNPYLSITDVSGTVGYADLTTFERDFKRCTKLAPRDYRRQLAERSVELPRNSADAPSIPAARSLSSSPSVATSIRRRVS